MNICCFLQLHTSNEDINKDIVVPKAAGNKIIHNPLLQLRRELIFNAVNEHCNNNEQLLCVKLSHLDLTHIMYAVCVSSILLYIFR